MPTIKLNIKEMKKLIGKKIPDEKLKERLCSLGMSVEGAAGGEMNIEVPPNRPDLLSEQGMARALSSLIGVKTGLKEYPVKISGEKVIIEKSVKDVRPFTACAIVKSLEFDDEKIKEIIQIQEKLHVSYGRNRKRVAIGVYPCEKIKPPITFFAEAPDKVMFRPLEFPREISGLQVLSQHPTGREYAPLLEGAKKFPFFKDSRGKILSMPPIINSHDVGKITEDTKEVFIECSGFNLEVLEKCLNMIVAALADMGGEIYSMELEYPDRKVITPNMAPEAMKVNTEFMNKWLGLGLKEKNVKNLLERMGFGFKSGNALIPAYRADVLHAVDLAEDIAIAYGYENFRPSIPKVATIAKEDSHEELKRRIAEILAGLGFYETNTYHLMSMQEAAANMGYEVECVEITNPTSSEFSVLRPWMLPSMMQVLKVNKTSEYPQLVFGMGAVFGKGGGGDTGISERSMLGIAISGKDANFTSAKQVIDYLMRMLGVEFKTREKEHPSFISGRCAGVAAGKQEIGMFGEISPAVVKRWELPMPVAAAEIDLGLLEKVVSRK